MLIVKNSEFKNGEINFQEKLKGDTEINQNNDKVMIKWWLNNDKVFVVINKPRHDCKMGRQQFPKLLTENIKKINKLLNKNTIKNKNFPTTKVAEK